MNTTITQVPGLRVGHALVQGGGSGCTVILGPFRAAVDVRGMASGTRELTVLDPEHLVDAASAQDSPFATRVPVQEVEMWVKRSDGEPACLLATALPLSGLDGEWCGARGLCRNITAERTHEAALAGDRNRERLLAYILGIENTGYSFQLKGFPDFNDPDRPPVVPLGVMVDHNYPSLLAEAGYEMVSSERLVYPIIAPIRDNQEMIVPMCYVARRRSS